MNHSSFRLLRYEKNLLLQNYYKKTAAICFNCARALLACHQRDARSYNCCHITTSRTWVPTAILSPLIFPLELCLLAKQEFSARAMLALTFKSKNFPLDLWSLAKQEFSARAMLALTFKSKNFQFSIFNFQFTTFHLWFSTLSYIFHSDSEGKTVANFNNR